MSKLLEYVQAKQIKYVDVNDVDEFALSME